MEKIKIRVDFHSSVGKRKCFFPFICVKPDFPIFWFIWVYICRPTLRNLKALSQRALVWSLKLIFYNLKSFKIHFVTLWPHLCVKRSEVFWKSFKLVLVKRKQTNEHTAGNLVQLIWELSGGHIITKWTDNAVQRRNLKFPLQGRKLHLFWL